MPLKKPRSITRRLRSLEKWAASFTNTFPPESSFYAPGYWNSKVPVARSLVEGKHSSRALKREVAVRLVQACQALIAAKPDWARTYRVTCTICLPDMHSSEICIYSSEEYFRSKCGEFKAFTGAQILITERSLSRDWMLNLPPGIQELGIQWQYDKCPDPVDRYISDHWVFGEVS